MAPGIEVPDVVDVAAGLGVAETTGAGVAGPACATNDDKTSIPSTTFMMIQKRSLAAKR